MQRCGASPDLERVINPKVAEAAKELSLKFSEQVNATTTKDINTALDELRQSFAEGRDAGERLGAITARVGEVFEGLETWRAEGIARTESARAYITGSQIAAKESGVVSHAKMILSPTACEEVCLPYNEENPVIDLDNSDLPLHMHCFCSLEYVLGDNQESDDDE